MDSTGSSGEPGFFVLDSEIQTDDRTLKLN
jgi:hypothetical protein